MSEIGIVENQGLRLIGQETLSLSGDYGKMITFLNQTLQDRGLIFGLSKSGDQLALTIYETKR